MIWCTHRIVETKERAQPGPDLIRIRAQLVHQKHDHPITPERLKVSLNPGTIEAQLAVRVVTTHNLTTTSAPPHISAHGPEHTTVLHTPINAMVVERDRSINGIPQRDNDPS
jgi:hypothetical protein